MPVQLRAAFLLLIAAMIGIDAAQAAEVKVMTANAVKQAYLELVSAFERSSGHKVTTIWGGTEEVAKRISGGEVVDIVIIAAPNIDRLILEGKLVSGSRADFAKSGVGIAVRTGLPKPDISSGEAVKRAVQQPILLLILRGRAASMLRICSRKWASPIRSKTR